MNENPKRPGDVSQSLNVTGATLRNYVKHFSKFLSDSATTKTRKRFTAEDIQTLKIAKSYLDQGLTYDQAADRLETIPLVGDVLEEDPEPQPEPTTENEYPIQSIEFFDNFIKQLSSQHEREIAAKDETIKILQDELKRAQRPWWDKLFRRPQG